MTQPANPNVTRIKIDYNNSPAVKALIEQHMEEIVKEATFAVEARAKMKAPVDTGALRNSIQSSFVTPRLGVVSTNIEYAAHIEFGTARTAAQPFMRNAVRAVRPLLRKRIQDLGGQIT